MDKASSEVYDEGGGVVFFAPGTWTLPAVSHGLLYVMQNETDRMTGSTARALCYDLRGR